MGSLELVQQNLTSPMVLCFALGAIARFIKSDLSLPKGAYQVLAIYLLLAIGLKGGVALSKVSLAEIVLPLVGTVVLGSLIPVMIFFVCRGLGRLDAVNSSAIAAHYGSVSAVTFIACLTFLDGISASYEGFASALVAIMEIPGIVVALLLGHRVAGRSSGMKEALHEIITGKSIILLAGGMIVGFATGAKGYGLVEPFFVQPFQGALCLFMLDMGLLAADRLSEVRKVGAFIVGLGVLAPLLLGALGVFTGMAVGLSVGGAAILGTLAASASYIAAPAAVRVALPEANPSLYLTAAVGITFPFNLALGIPIYHAMSVALHR